MPQLAKQVCEYCVGYEFMLVPPHRSVECWYWFWSNSTLSHMVSYQDPVTVVNRP